jgi:glycine/D-amino acid oxidase-like deaminating enzyme
MPDLDAHVILIGGGIAGLATAWRLRHRDVLLLEALQLKRRLRKSRITAR